MAKDLFNFSLENITPESIKHDKLIKAASFAINKELISVSHAISEAFIISRIDELPESLIDLLAWQWHVDYYEPDLDLNIKRELVKSSISWHRIKGTPQAVEQLVSQVFGNAKVTEWFNYGGREYFFRLAVYVGGDNTLELSSQELIKLRRVIKCAQNARSWLEFISLVYDLEDVQVSNDELKEIRLLLGYADKYNYKNKNVNNYDFLKFNDKDLCFYLDANVFADIFDKAAPLFDGSIEFSSLDLVPGFNAFSDLVNIDDLYLIMRVNAFKDDYSHVVKNLILDGNLSFNFDNNLAFSGGACLDGKYEFNNLDLNNLSLAKIILPVEGKFYTQLKYSMHDDLNIKEFNNIALKALIEDYYFSNKKYINKFDKDLIFRKGKMFEGGLAFNAKDLAFNNAFDFDFDLNNLEFTRDNRAYRREYFNLSLSLNNFLKDDYSREEVKLEFNDKALNLNGAVEFKEALNKLDGSLKFNDIDLDLNNKKFINLPIEQAFNAELDINLADEAVIDESEFEFNIDFCPAFNGGYALDGRLRFGYERLNKDIEILRPSFNDALSFNEKNISFMQDALIF